jgi:glycosyltransferase involved in cell wall biosynthesis
MAALLASDGPGGPLVSVIVPCYNSARTIRRCLTAIVNQRTTVPFDITVVDSSEDRTPEIVQQEFTSVRLIHLPQRTFAGAARNVGIRATVAPYCLMIDSDCVAAPDLIERIVARHAEGDYAAVGGSLRNGTPRSVSGWVGYLMEFKTFMPTTPMRLETSVPTANVAYRRDVLERYGYFDDSMWLAEDILFNWKLYTAGERILFDPAIEVVHLNRTGWRCVLSYQVSLGKLAAIARGRGGLPGGELLERPARIALVPIRSVVRAWRWLAAHDPAAFRVFLCLSPLYFVAACFWSVGLFQGAMVHRRSS